METYIVIAAVAATLFVLLSTRNTQFFVHRLAAHATALEAYVEAYRQTLDACRAHVEAREKAKAQLRAEREQQAKVDEILRQRAERGAAIVNAAARGGVQ